MNKPIRRALSLFLALTLAVSPLTAAADGLSGEAQEPEILEEIEEITESAETPEISEEPEVEKEPEEPAEEETVEPEETEEIEEEAEDAEASADLADAEVMASTVISGSCGTNVTYVLDSNGVLTISGSGKMRDYASGSSTPWYSQRSSIKSVVIENGVTSIGDYAFLGCKLSSFDIPDSVSSIGTAAFSSCSQLTSVVIPDFVSSINGLAFYNCENLTSVVIGNAVSSIGNDSFNKCSKLKTITIGNSVKSIGNSAFYECIGLENVVIPDSVTTIGDYVFAYCYSLTGITIPDSVTTIGTTAFGYCDGLTNVIIGSGINSISDYAFRTCDSLKTIKFMGAAPKISSNAFYQVNATVYFSIYERSWSETNRINYGGTLVWQPDFENPGFGSCSGDYYWSNAIWRLDAKGVLTISGTGNMVNYLPDGNWYYEIPSFFPEWYDFRSYVCSVIIEEGITSIGDYSFYNCSNLTSISLPSSLTAIGSDAFIGCISLRTINLPDSVSQISQTAFKLSGGLENINVGTKNAQYASVNGVLFNKSKTTLIFYPSKKNSANYVMPAGVTTIGVNAFYECKTLTSVKLPDSLKKIGNNAFYGCTNLKEIYFLGNVPGCDISYDAYRKSMGRWEDTFHTYYPATPFYGVTANAYFPQGNTTWENYYLQNYGGSITWYSYNYSSNQVGTFYKQFALTGKCGYDLYWCLDEAGELTIGGSGEMLHRKCEIGYDGPYQHYDGTRLYWPKDDVKKVIIKSGVTSIEEDVFPNSTQLREIWFEGDAPEFSYWIYDDCMLPGHFTGITAAIYYPRDNSTWTDDVLQSYNGNITWIPYGDSSDLGSGTCGKNLTWVLDAEGTLTVSGSGAMEDYLDNGTPWNSNLTDIRAVVIESGVTHLGDRAFQGAVNLGRVSLPNTLTSVGQFVFNGCAGLTEAAVPSSLTTLGTGMFRDCSGLKSVTLPAGLTGLATWAFYGCTSLTTVSIPQGVTEIGKNTFQNCTNLSSITLPQGITKIDYYAFDGCKSLKTLEIPNGVSYIGSYAFRGMTGVKTMVIPDSVTAMGNFVFTNDTGLTSVTLSNQLTELGINVFQNCSSLTAIDIPAKISAIGTMTFSGCTRLKTVTFHGNAPKISEKCFSTGFTANYPCSGKNWSSAVFRNTGATPTLVKYHPEEFHTETAKVEPTCTQPGSVGGVVCGSCGASIQSAAVIPALGHSYVPTVTEPTCTAKGYTTFTCSVCGDSYTGEETNFAPHTFREEWFSNAEGHWHYCAVCEAQSPVEPHIPDRSAPTADADQCCKLCRYVMASFKYLIVIDAPATLMKAGTYMQLSYHVEPEKDVDVVWSLDDGDEYFASLSQTGRLVAKSVTTQQTVTVFASDAAGECVTGKLSVIICPAPTAISIREGTAVTVNVNEHSTVSFTALCAPAGCAGNVEWKTSDSKGTYGTFRDNHDNTCTLTDLKLPSGKAATITLTAVVAGTDIQSSVTVKLISAPIPGSICVTGPESLRGGASASYKASVNLSVPLTDKTMVFALRPQDLAYASITSAGKLTTKAVPEAVDLVVSAYAKGYSEVVGSLTVHLLPTAQQVSVQSPEAVVHDGILSKNLMEGNSIQLTASVQPAQAMQSGTWKSSSTAIATVDSTGLVTFQKTGTVTITFTADDGSKKAASVKIAAGNPVMGLQLSGPDALISGGKATLKAAFENVPTIKKLVWSSSDSTVATVSASGAVTAKTVYEEKTVTITAKATDGSGAAAVHTITVSPKPNVLPIWDASGNVVTNQTLNLDTQTSTLSLTAPAGVVWKSSAPKVVEVENGRLTLLKAGKATITVKSADGKQSGKVIVKVSTLVRSLQIVTDASAPLVSGKGKLTLKTQVNADASLKTVTWTSSDPAAASVSTSGVVTAKSGILKDTQVTIRATAKDGSGKFAEVVITVIPASTAVHVYSVEALTCADGIQLRAGETLNGRTLVLPVSQKFALGAKVFPNALGAHAQQTVTWKSSSTKIAQVDANGLVTAAKPGTVTITVKTADGKTNTVKLKFQ